MPARPNDLLGKSVSAFRPLEPLKILIFSAIITGLVTLLWFVMSQTFDWLESALVLVVALTYYLLRQVLGTWRMKRVFVAQQADAIRRFPELILYAPMADDRGGLFVPKNAALGFSVDRLWLVTFKQRLFATAPQDAIRVPLGPDFRIRDLRPGKKQTVHVLAALMGTPLEFAVCDDSNLQARLVALPSQNISKEV